MSWTIVDSRVARPEALHHAIDQRLLEAVAAGTQPPTLRIWYRNQTAVPLGRFQAYADEVAVDYVEANEIPVIRRITGGGAMFVHPGAVITYSMYLPADQVADDVETSYRELNEWVLEALNRVGLEAAHEPLNDIVHPDGKLGGAAQLRKQDAVLHHATMSYALDIEEMLRVLRIGEEKLSDKAVKSAEQRVAVMTDYIDLPRDAVVQTLLDTFIDTYGGTQTELDDALLADARQLAADKFETDAWNKQL